MVALSWDTVSNTNYEYGVDHGVLYLDGDPGVVWNGLVSVQESYDGGEVTSLYFDEINYLNQVANRTFKATITAFSFPVEFYECLGLISLRPGVFLDSQEQTRFGLSYRSNVGPDGYRLHLVYNCLATPTQKDSRTLTATPTPDSRAWDVVAIPDPNTSHKPTSHLIIDSRRTDSYTMASIETDLYGSGETNPFLPTQEAIVSYFESIAT